MEGCLWYIRDGQKVYGWLRKADVIRREREAEESRRTVDGSFKCNNRKKGCNKAVWEGENGDN